MLLNQGFPVAPGASFFDDFPVWDTAKFPGREVEALGYALSGTGRFVAAAGLRPARLRTPQGAVPVGLVGGVVADPAFQGQGLASGLIDALGARAASLGLSGLVLWGSEHALYRRLGFELCGVQRRIPLADLTGFDALAIEGVRTGRGWSDALWPALERHRFLGLAIEPGDRAWFAAHRNVDWRWTLDARGEVSAYLAVGRGIDLPNIIHEWGGEPRLLRALMARAARDYPAGELLAPSESLLPPGFSLPGGVQEYLCMARSLKPDMPEPSLLWLWGLDGA